MKNFRVKKYFYLVPIEDMVFEMLESSYCDLKTVGSLTSLEKLESYESALRIVTNYESDKRYYVLPFSYSFSTAMKGQPFFTVEEIKENLMDSKYIKPIIEEEEE